MDNQTDMNEVDVLLVEDNPNDAELIANALKKLNMINKSFLTKDGEEALEFIFRTGRYAGRTGKTALKVILMDLKLPRLNGLEVLAKIKADPSTKSIPVVVLTSSKEDNDVKESYRLGVNSYIVKPIQSGDFVSALSQAGLYWMVLNRPALSGVSMVAPNAMSAPIVSETPVVPMTTTQTVITK